MPYKVFTIPHDPNDRKTAEQRRAIRRDKWGARTAKDSASKRVLHTKLDSLAVPVKTEDWYAEDT